MNELDLIKQRLLAKYTEAASSQPPENELVKPTKPKPKRRGRPRKSDASAPADLDLLTEDHIPQDEVRNKDFGDDELFEDNGQDKNQDHDEFGGLQEHGEGEEGETETDQNYMNADVKKELPEYDDGQQQQDIYESNFPPHMIEDALSSFDLGVGSDLYSCFDKSLQSKLKKLDKYSKKWIGSEIPGGDGDDKSNHGDNQTDKNTEENEKANGSTSGASTKKEPLKLKYSESDGGRKLKKNVGYSFDSEPVMFEIEPEIPEQYEDYSPDFDPHQEEDGEISGDSGEVFKPTIRAIKTKKLKRKVGRPPKYAKSAKKKLKLSSNKINKRGRKKKKFIIDDSDDDIVHFPTTTTTTTADYEEDAAQNNTNKSKSTRKSGRPRRKIVEDEDDPDRLLAEIFGDDVLENNDNKMEAKREIRDPDPDAVPKKRGRGRPKKIRNDDEIERENIRPRIKRRPYTKRSSFDKFSTQRRAKALKQRSLRKPKPIEPSEFYCEVDGCDNMLFTKRVDFQIHQLKVHGISDVVCNVCGLKCANRGVLNKHMHSHVEGKNFICEFCSKAFKYNNCLQRHRKLDHLGETPPSLCTICGKSFKQASGLYNHQRIFHEKVKPGQTYTRHINQEAAQCTVCGKQFRTLYYLNHYHMPIHKAAEGEILKKHYCVICKKQFVKKESLSFHILTVHEGHNPFKCEIEGCNVGYRDKRALHNHYRKVHPQEAKEMPNLVDYIREPRFKCEYCPPGEEKTFTHKHYYLLHRSTHTKEKAVTCNICNKSFCHKGYMKTHMEGVHGVGAKSHVCEFDNCSKRFPTRKYLLDHQKKHNRAKNGAIRQYTRTKKRMDNVYNDTDLANFRPPEEPEEPEDKEQQLLKNRMLINEFTTPTISSFTVPQPQQVQTQSQYQFPHMYQNQMAMSYPQQQQQQLQVLQQQQQQLQQQQQIGAYSHSYASSQHSESNSQLSHQYQNDDDFTNPPTPPSLNSYTSDEDSISSSRDLLLPPPLPPPTTNQKSFSTPAQKKITNTTKEKVKKPPKEKTPKATKSKNKNNLDTAEENEEDIEDNVLKPDPNKSQEENDKIAEAAAQKKQRSKPIKKGADLSNNPNAVKCDLCDQWFSSYNYMKYYHMIKHSGQQYKCEACNKVFVRSQTLKHHMLTVHDKVVPYPCHVDGCLCEFKDKRAFQRHLRSVHPEEDAEAPFITTFHHGSTRQRAPKRQAEQQQQQQQNPDDPPVPKKRKKNINTNTNTNNNNNTNDNEVLIANIPLVRDLRLTNSYIDQTPRLSSSSAAASLNQASSLVNSHKKMAQYIERFQQDLAHQQLQHNQHQHQQQPHQQTSIINQTLNQPSSSSRFNSAVFDQQIIGPSTTHTTPAQAAAALFFRNSIPQQQQQQFLQQQQNFFQSQQQQNISQQQQHSSHYYN